jgi:3-hydroxyisobutyrate dehydrogenase
MAATDATLRIGWIGAGTMGAPMCGHLLAAGHRVDLFTRTRATADELIERGARWCESPAEAAAEADVVLSMVGYPSDVHDVLLGDAGAVRAARPGSLLIDFTTSEPSLAVEIHEAARERDVESLDAPVSGGDVGAREARLTIMVGGAEEAFARAKPILELLGRSVVHEGGPGAGQHTKVMNQIAIASGMIGVCESLLYAVRSGLDVERALDTIAGGAAGSWSLSNYGPRALAGDFAPGFKIEHFLKDLGIALAEARRMNLSLPGLALAEQLYVAAGAHGLARSGTHALLLSLAAMSDVEWPSEAPPRAGA